MRFSLATTIFPLAVCAAVLPKPVVKNNGIAMKLAERTPSLNPNDTVDIDILNAHVASFTAKVLRGFDNYERNTGTAHPSAVISMNGTGLRERAGAGAAPQAVMTNQRSWYTELFIGTPPQKFYVQIDTGSSDMFVAWYICDSTCDGHTRWYTEESSTAVMTVVDGNYKGFKLNFANNAAVTGQLYEDTVSIAGFTAREQVIGAASTYSPQFSKSIWAPDGMMGMGFDSLALFGGKPLQETLADSNVILPIFSLKLASGGGELYLGGVNPALYKGEFTYIPVTQKAFWQVEIQSIHDEKGTVALTNVPAIIDTGTTYIIGDSDRVARMHAVLGGTHVAQGYYSFPCDSFPTISFTFNGKSFEIPPENLKMHRVTATSDKCFSSIFGKDTGSSFWSIGAAFLKGYYTTFEFGATPRIGFAELR